MPALTFAKNDSAAPASAGRLRIGKPDDAYEQEAERITSEMMRGRATRHHWSLSRLGGGGPVLRRCSCGSSSSSEGECTACKQQREAGAQTLRRKAAAAFDSAVAPPIVHEVLNSPGQPLDRATRAYFEARLGHDLSTVRVHSDSVAAASAGTVRAKAYTVGNHIAFADGQFAPGTSEGRSLLGHELVHVAQQVKGAPGHHSGLNEEAEARAVGDRGAFGGSANPFAFTSAPIHLARYVSPYNETLGVELLERLRQLRIAQGGASAAQQARRVGAVAAVFDRAGNRIGTIERMNVPGGAHAEQLVLQEVEKMIAAGHKIEYTVVMVDQDPCPGTCRPLLKEWAGNPKSGTVRVVTPMAVNKVDPSKMVSGKTAYQRALTQDAVPFEPKTPPPGDAAYIGTRKDLSKVRLPLAPQAGSPAVEGGPVEPPKPAVEVKPPSGEVKPPAGETPGATGLLKSKPSSVGAVSAEAAATAGRFSLSGAILGFIVEQAIFAALALALQWAMAKVFEALLEAEIENILKPAVAAKLQQLEPKLTALAGTKKLMIRITYDFIYQRDSPDDPVGSFMQGAPPFYEMGSMHLVNVHPGNEELDFPSASSEKRERLLGQRERVTARSSYSVLLDDAPRRLREKQMSEIVEKHRVKQPAVAPPVQPPPAGPPPPPLLPSLAPQQARQEFTPLPGAPGPSPLQEIDRKVDAGRNRCLELIADGERLLRSSSGKDAEIKKFLKDESDWRDMVTYWLLHYKNNGPDYGRSKCDELANSDQYGGRLKQIRQHFGG